MDNEQIPLLIIGRFIKKHRIVSSAIVLAIFLAVGSYFVISKKIKEKRAMTEMTQAVDHLGSIIGVYKGEASTLH